MTRRYKDMVHRRHIREVLIDEPKGLTRVQISTELTKRHRNVPTPNQLRMILKASFKEVGQAERAYLPGNKGSPIAVWGLPDGS